MPKSKKYHKHPSYPYMHPKKRKHRFGKSSRIKDRKGKKFRQTAQEKRKTYVKTTYKPRAKRKKKRYD